MNNARIRAWLFAIRAVRAATEAGLTVLDWLDVQLWECELEACHDCGWMPATVEEVEGDRLCLTCAKVRLTEEASTKEER